MGNISPSSTTSSSPKIPPTAIHEFKASSSDHERPTDLVNAVKELNSEYIDLDCGKAYEKDTVLCNNIRATMMKLGLPASPPVFEGGMPPVQLRNPRIVHEPSRLVSERDASALKRCSERCGLVTSILAAFVGGAAVQQVPDKDLLGAFSLLMRHIFS